MFRFTPCSIRLSAAAVAAALGLLAFASGASAASSEAPWCPQRDDPWLPTVVEFPCDEGHVVSVPTTLPGGYSVCGVLHMIVDDFFTTPCPAIDPTAAAIEAVFDSWTWGTQPSSYDLGDLGSEDWVYRARVTFYCIS